jgi:hypothetical protein
MSRLPHSIHSRHTDGGDVVSLMRRPPFNMQEDSWYSFLSEAQSPQGHSAAGRLGSNEISNDLVGNRTRDLPTCSIVHLLIWWLHNVSNTE